MLSTYKWSAMEFKSTYHSISIIRHYPFIWNCWETGMACLEEFVAYQRNPWFFIEECVKQKKKQNLKCLVTPTVSFTVYDCFLHRLRKFIIYLSLSPNLLSKETILVVVVDVDWCLSSKNFALLIVSLPKIKPSKYSAYYILCLS